jgi:hypothetical protein
MGVRHRGFWVLVFLVLAGCSQEVSRVGEIAVSEKDLSLRSQVSEIYYPGSGKRYVALAQLVQGYLSLQVLESLGQNADPSTLEAEAKRIERDTKAPEALKRIQAVYARDPKAYLLTFVRVVYAERVLYQEVFPRSPDIQGERHQKAEAFLQEALKSPSSFAHLAQQRDLEPVRLEVSLEKGIRPLTERGKRMDPPSEADREQAQRLLKTASQIRPGAVYPKIIEWLESYQVIRLLGRLGKVFLLESVSVPKREYEEWFWEQASKIPVKIHDQALQKELLREVPWAKKLRME